MSVVEPNAALLFIYATPLSSPCSNRFLMLMTRSFFRIVSHIISLYNSRIVVPSCNLLFALRVWLGRSGDMSRSRLTDHEWLQVEFLPLTLVDKDGFARIVQ